MNVKIKKLHPKAIIPTFHTEGSAGFDLCARIDEPLTLFPGKELLIPTGFAMHINDPTVAAVIIPRSGLGHKEGIVLGNGAGLIDSDYQGQVFVSLFQRRFNITDQRVIKPNDRIAQMFFIPIIRPTFDVIDDFETTTDRGTSGFGHTGVSL